MRIRDSFDLSSPNAVGIEIEEPEPRLLGVDRERAASRLKLNAR